MNDKNRHKETRQINHQIDDPKSDDSVFLFFANAHFIKTILATAQVALLVLTDTQANALQNQKSHFFANALEKHSEF